MARGITELLSAIDRSPSSVRTHPVSQVRSSQQTSNLPERPTSLSVLRQTRRERRPCDSEGSGGDASLGQRCRLLPTVQYAKRWSNACSGGSEADQNPGIPRSLRLGPRGSWRTHRHDMAPISRCELDRQCGSPTEGGWHSSERPERSISPDG